MPPGTIGRVFAGSDTLHAFTYLGQPGRRAAVGHGDLVTAGDLGWLDRDGYLFLAGREAEAIRVGAETIHPASVEAALAAEAGVADCAVLDLEAGEGRAGVTACIEPLAGATLDLARLAAVLAGALPPTARPGNLRIVERLPREPSGKLSKPRLRRMLAATERPQRQEDGSRESGG